MRTPVGRQFFVASPAAIYGQDAKPTAHAQSASFVIRILSALMDQEAANSKLPICLQTQWPANGPGNMNAESAWWFAPAESHYCNSTML